MLRDDLNSSQATKSSLSKFMHACIHASRDTYIHKVYTPTYMYIYVSTCIYVRVYTHTHTHTHTHILGSSPVIGIELRMTETKYLKCISTICLTPNPTVNLIS